METIKVDYGPKGVQFYYIYKPLAHPELDHYISPFTLKERLMHIAEAKRRLGSSITWLADTMDNKYHKAMGQTPNSELLIDPDGIVVGRRAWSKPDKLRADLGRLLGAVDKPTTIADLDIPMQPPRPTVARGIVPRVKMPAGAMPMQITPLLEKSELPFYTKLRAEGTPELFKTGKGTLYIGFHLDPIYQVHWNNEAPPLEYEFTTPKGVTVTPAKFTALDPKEPADADPREFLVQVDAGKPNVTLDLSVKYYACDNALTFCVPVQQDYQVHLARDTSHAWSMPTSPDGTINRGGRAPRGLMRRPSSK